MFEMASGGHHSFKSKAGPPNPIQLWGKPLVYM